MAHLEELKDIYDLLGFVTMKLLLYGGYPIITAVCCLLSADIHSSLPVRR